MFSVFNVIPTGFFNNLASGSNQRIYSDCIQLIYKEYEREISYRIPRNRIRDSLAIYFLENHVELSQEDYSGDKTANDMAGAVIRKFLSKDVGWLEEEIDDATYEKQIVMTENGIALAEFLNQLEKPEKEEFSSYIYNIYNTLNNSEQWKENPYVNGIKNINKNARDLSKALKKLSTFIRKIIEKMVQEKTLESLTENILEYCEGDFIREYSRLTKQQNIHIYRMFIKTRLDAMIVDNVIFEQMVESCAKEENLNYEQSHDAVLDMIQATKRFLVEDYDQIMRDIKHKINVYLQIAVGRARFIRNREKDVRGNVERTMRYIMEELTELTNKDNLPESMDVLFTLDRHVFIDEGSIRYPRQNQTIKTAVVTEIEEMTEEAKQAAKAAQEKEAYNPYSRDLMKLYLDKKMGAAKELDSDELPLNTKGDMLASLSSIAYARENGFEVEPMDGYIEVNNMILRRFKITREES
jgi:hypothetical protein